MYRTFHPVAAEYTFFSVVHLTFSRRDQVIGHQKKLLENLRILKSYWVSFQPQWHKTGNWYQEVNSQICGDKTKHSQSCRLKKKSKWQFKKKESWNE